MDQTQAEVSAAALSRNFALWQDRAQREPVVITHHGRARSVLLGIDEYRRRVSDGPRPPIAGLFDETDDAMMSLQQIGGEWSVTALNAAAAAMARSTRERALGKPARLLVGELGEAEAVGRLDGVWRSGRPAEWRCEAGQHSRALVMRAVRLDDQLGLVICGAMTRGGHSSPISETRPFLDRLLPASGLAYATLDGEARFVFVSERFASVIGGSRDIFLDGLRLAEMLVRDQGDDVDEVLYQAAARMVPVELAKPRRGAEAAGRTITPADGAGDADRRFFASVTALPAEANRQPGYLLLLNPAVVSG